MIIKYDFNKKAVTVHSKFLGKILSFDANLKSNSMGDCLPQAGLRTSVTPQLEMNKVFVPN